MEATSWRDLEARLSREGLRLEPRGRGLVVTDGKEEVKLSSVAPRVSRANLERRFGAMYGEQQDIGERQSSVGLRERLQHTNATPPPPAEALEMMLRFAEHQRVLSETERNLAYTVETLRRQADRAGWLQTGVIVLALIAGMLGGMTAGLLILAWMQ